MSKKENEINSIAIKYGLPSSNANNVLHHILSLDEYLFDWHKEDVNGKYYDEDEDNGLLGMVDDALIDEYWKVRTFLNI